MDTSYLAVVRLPGFTRLALATLVAAPGGRWLQLPSCSLSFRDTARPRWPDSAWSIPGLLLSPVAGALLDRYGRARLIALDFGVAVATLASIETLSLVHLLTPWLLIVIAALGSMTVMLSNSGLRTYYATLVPRHLWPRANAIDSNGWTFAVLVGPPAAGVLVGAVGGEWTLVAIGGAMGIAAVVVHRLPEGRAAGSLRVSLHQEAVKGLRYFGWHRTLRGRR